MAQKNQSFPKGTAKKLLQQFYHIEGELLDLPGTEDHNFRIRQEGPDLLLKVSPAGSDQGMAEFQNDLLSYLYQKAPYLNTPVPVENKDGAGTFTFSSDDEEPRHVRLISWVKGRVWSEVNPITNQLRSNLGTYCGQLTAALARYEHPGSRRELEWDIAHSLWTCRELNRFTPEEQKLLGYFQERFRKRLASYERLRKQVVHNDVNDNNIIVNESLTAPEVVACVDFGDAVHTQVINDVAIAITYAVLHVPQPLQAAIPLLKSYHQAFPISEEELDHLYDCVGMRLVISVTQSAISKEENPANEYLRISERPAWALLGKWKNLSPELATYSFRAACGYPAHPGLSHFLKWTETTRFTLRDLFPGIPEMEVFTLDLDVGSTWFGNEREFNDLPLFSYRLDKLRAMHPGAIPAGGYLEPRPMYTSPAFERVGNHGLESRTVHLGLDFWLAAGTAVHTPVEGIVVEAVDNNRFKEYGGLVILEHNLKETQFYSLYGHLSVSSIRQLAPGDHIPAGGRVGVLGTAEENGQWVPHLHFQLMLSLLDYQADFPGVCYPREIEAWSGICPDPNLLFRFSALSARKNKTAGDLLDYRKKHLGKSLSLQYEQPLHIVRGTGAYLMDSTGQKYLDTVNNVAHVGHEHPDVVAAGQQQMAVLNTNTRYLHQNLNQLTEELLRTLPSELRVVHYVNSGSEANELALRMVKAATGSEQFIVSQWGYHGNTNATVAISSYKFDRKGGQGCPPNVHPIPMPDPFRGKYRGEDAASGYLAELKERIANISASGKKPGGFIMEPILSCGGQIVPPDGFLAAAYKMVREAGGLCISDEVQVGCGRPGSTFWGFQLHGVTPDIITIGKPLGNGHPLAAVVCTQEVAEAFANGMEYFNTFGGNPVSCAIGSAVLRVVHEEKLQQNALETGAFLRNGLLDLQAKFPVIGDVRGHGLFLGFELNGQDLKPLPEKAHYLVNRMKENGILMSTDGPADNVIKIKPPLVFDKTHASILLDTLEGVLGEDFMICEGRGDVE